MLRVFVLGSVLAAGCVSEVPAEDANKSLGNDETLVEETLDVQPALSVSRDASGGVVLAHGTATLRIEPSTDERPWRMHFETPFDSMVKDLSLVPTSSIEGAPTDGPAYALVAADDAPLPESWQVAFGPLFEAAAAADPADFGVDVAAINGVSCFWVGVLGGVGLAYFGGYGFLGGFLFTWIACAVLT